MKEYIEISLEDFLNRLQNKVDVNLMLKDGDFETIVEELDDE